jgi:hypothetical protein
VLITSSGIAFHFSLAGGIVVLHPNRGHTLGTVGGVHWTAAPFFSYNRFPIESKKEENHSSNTPCLPVKPPQSPEASEQCKYLTGFAPFSPFDAIAIKSPILFGSSLPAWNLVDLTEEKP